MNRILPGDPPQLPLLLWKTPPGLELILAQEGVPFLNVREAHRLAFAAGRFVLYDSRRESPWRLRSLIGPEHVALDVDVLRRQEAVDPFEELVACDATDLGWRVGGAVLTERVARVDRASIRARLLDRIRGAVFRAGGVWCRLAAFPYPFRSAFSFRVDLDEPEPDDYLRFAQGRRSLADCTTHFVSTAAYDRFPAILDDLRQYDTQSHGHYHFVYREERFNRRNLQRAHELLCQAGMTPTGFAAPGGRWNHGLDRSLEALGYEYSSDFSIGRDDRPFFPWLGNRFSQVLQIPVHPVCEGLFLEAGVADPKVIAGYLVSVLRSRIASGEPAFLYGHPERRLGRFPEVLDAIASALAGQSFVWRVPLTSFARWWRWRHARRWAVVAKGAGLVELQFDDWDSAYRMGLEIVRGDHVATVPITGPRATLRLTDLAFVRSTRRDAPAAERVRRPWSLRCAVRQALDWETVTPLDDLGADSVRSALKKGLRRWRRPGAGS